MKKVSVKQAIIDAIEMSEPGMGRYMNFLIKWSKYIEKAIDSNTGHQIKSVVVMADGCELLIPDDCFRILKLYPGDHTQECDLYYKSYNDLKAYVDDSRGHDVDYIWRPMTDQEYISETLWREYGDKIHLVRQYVHEPVTILYQAVETDPDGMWIVNESHIDAITKFLVFKYAMKFQFKALMGEKMVRNSYREIVMSYERDYSIAVRNARAVDGHESVSDPVR